MANILIDTSAWVDFFKRPLSQAAETVDHLLKADQACTTGVVIAELIRGIRTSHEREVLVGRFSALSVLDTTQAIWIATGTLAATLSQHGLTLPLTDLLVAAIAQAYGCLIYTTDHHFARIPHVQLYQPA